MNKQKKAPEINPGKPTPKTHIVEVPQIIPIRKKPK